jgi:hypothetical protein
VYTYTTCQITRLRPCERADLPAKLDKDPSWRAGALFTAPEVGALVFDPRVPEDRRTLYAIELLGGLRTGEAAARRWRDWDDAVAPLASLLVAPSFDSRTHTEGPTKTRPPRRVPVHPVTAEVLARWKADGWQRTFGRPPEPGDLICPSASGRFRTAQLSYNHFSEDLTRLGLRHRRHYDTRRTFIRLGVAGGGRKDVLRWITHSPGDVFDEYTTLPWETLCQAVTAIQIPVPEAGSGLQLASAAPAGTEAVRLAVTLADLGSARKREAPGIIQFRGPLEWRGVGDSKNPSSVMLTRRRHAEFSLKFASHMKKVAGSSSRGCPRSPTDPLQEWHENGAALHKDQAFLAGRRCTRESHLRPLSERLLEPTQHRGLIFRDLAP